MTRALCVGWKSTYVTGDEGEIVEKCWPMNRFEFGFDFVNHRTNRVLQIV